MIVPHRGGLQLRTTDYAYDVLRQWIAEGGGVDAAEGKRCVRLELLPASGRVLKIPHREQQIVARAHFENGSVRDVTRADQILVVRRASRLGLWRWPDGGASARPGGGDGPLSRSIGFLPVHARPG